eukprot:m.450529 g.450529  ORF g.450529 m.450529 type:complete len:1575 (-) comp20015_c0_seq1:43-4767(-)
MGPAVKVTNRAAKGASPARPRPQPLNLGNTQSLSDTNGTLATDADDVKTAPATLTVAPMLRNKSVSVTNSPQGSPYAARKSDNDAKSLASDEGERNVDSPLISHKFSPLPPRRGLSRSWVKSESDLLGAVRRDAADSRASSRTPSFRTTGPSSPKSAAGGTVAGEDPKTPRMAQRRRSEAALMLPDGLRGPPVVRVHSEGSEDATQRRAPSLGWLTPDAPQKPFSEAFPEIEEERRGRSLTRSGSRRSRTDSGSNDRARSLSPESRPATLKADQEDIKFFRRMLERALATMTLALEHEISEVINDSRDEADGSMAPSTVVNEQIVEVASALIDSAKNDVIESTHFDGASLRLSRLLEHNPPERSAAKIRQVLNAMAPPARLLECRDRAQAGFVGPDDRLWMMTSNDYHLPAYIQERITQRAPNPNLSSDSGGTAPKHGPRAQFLEELVEGEKPGRNDFDIIKLIASGAYGSVHLGQHKKTKEHVAIKVLSKKIMVDKNCATQVLAEKEVLKFASNPFVVQFFCSFTTQQSLYIVMEYAGGGDLANYLKNMGQLLEREARRYIAESVLAVEYIHTFGIVHRDLKPDNLIISESGHIKLTDFGLSKIGLMAQYKRFKDESTSPATENVANQAPVPCFSGDDVPGSPGTDREGTTILGTPDYMAPEVVLARGYDKPVDWWSLGVILYEFVVGLPPFTGNTPEEIFHNVLHNDVEWPPDEAFSEIEMAPPTAELRDFVKQLLQKEPSDRLGSTDTYQLIIDETFDIKNHPFFENRLPTDEEGVVDEIDWDGLLEEQACFIPVLDDETDVSYFDDRSQLYGDRLDAAPSDNEDGESDVRNDSADRLGMFRNFSCVNLSAASPSPSRPRSPMSTESSPVPSSQVASALDEERFRYVDTASDSNDESAAESPPIKYDVRTEVLKGHASSSSQDSSPSLSPRTRPKIRRSTTKSPSAPQSATPSPQPSPTGSIDDLHRSAITRRPSSARNDPLSGRGRAAGVSGLATDSALSSSPLRNADVSVGQRSTPPQQRASAKHPGKSGDRHPKADVSARKSRNSPSSNRGTSTPRKGGATPSVCPARCVPFCTMHRVVPSKNKAVAWGFNLESAGGVHRVRDMVPGGPADQAGIYFGFIVCAVNDTNVSGWSRFKLAKHMREVALSAGPEGVLLHCKKPQYRVTVKGGGGNAPPPPSVQMPPPRKKKQRPQESSPAASRAVAPKGPKEPSPDKKSPAEKKSSFFDWVPRMFSTSTPAAKPTAPEPSSLPVGVPVQRLHNAAAGQDTQSGTLPRRKTTTTPSPRWWNGKKSSSLPRTSSDHGENGRARSSYLRESLPLQASGQDTSARPLARGSSGMPPSSPLRPLTSSNSPRSSLDSTNSFPSPTLLVPPSGSDWGGQEGPIRRSISSDNHPDRQPRGLRDPAETSEAADRAARQKSVGKPSIHTPPSARRFSDDRPQRKSSAPKPGRERSSSDPAEQSPARSSSKGSGTTSTSRSHQLSVAKMSSPGDGKPSRSVPSSPLAKRQSTPIDIPQANSSNHLSTRWVSTSPREGSLSPQMSDAVSDALSDGPSVSLSEHSVDGEDTLGC